MRAEKSQNSRPRAQALSRVTDRGERKRQGEGTRGGERGSGGERWRDARGGGGGEGEGERWRGEADGNGDGDSCALSVSELRCCCLIFISCLLPERESEEKKSCEKQRPQLVVNGGGRARIYPLPLSSPPSPGLPAQASTGPWPCQIALFLRLLRPGRALAPHQKLI